MNKWSSHSKTLFVIIMTLFGYTTLFGQNRVITHYYGIDSSLIQDQITVDENNIAQGEYTAYYPNQKVQRKGQYKNNQHDGTWEFFYQNGQLKQQGEFLEGTPNGKWSYYYENGQPRMSGNLLQNQKSGHWKHYYENGLVKSEGSYEKGKKEGQWTYYHEDGSYKAEGVFKGDNGIYIEYYDNENVKMSGKIHNGKSTGEWKYYHRNGNLKGVGKEINGLKEGEWNFYYESGELQSTGNFKNGKSTGEWKYYHKNGKVEAQGQQNGTKRDGYWTMFFPSGEKKAVANYALDSNGTYDEYYESGKIKVTGQFKNGEHDGIWKYYYEDNSKEGICNYTDGEGIHKTYHPNGNIREEGVMVNGERVGNWKLYNEEGTHVGYYQTDEEYHGTYAKKFEMIEDTVRPRRDTLSASSHSVKSKNQIKPRKIDDVYNGKRSPIIVSTNPFGVFFDQIPLSVEFYNPNPKRFSTQIDVAYVREPFFSNFYADSAHVYGNGFYGGFRLKNYKDNKRAKGKAYFAHDARLNMIWHSSQFINNDNSTVIINMQETRYEYSGLFGIRYLQYPRRRQISRQFSAEFFLGLGLSFRQINKSWENNPDYDGRFSVIDQTPFNIPIRLGFSFGYVF